MNRLACSITTAISLGCSFAWATQPFELALRVQNASSDLIQPTRLCGLYPLALNGVDVDWRVSGPLPPERRLDSYCFPLEAMGPYQSRQLALQWFPTEKREVESVPPPASYDLVENPSAELIELADSFRQYPAEDRVERIFEWMRSNIAFSGIRRGVDGAEHALLARVGDCTEHMLLAGELLNRNGVTIRRVLGVALPDDPGRITAATLHNWIEYLDNGKWLVFDSSKGLIGAFSNQNYIALFFYENSRQLDIQPFTTDSPRLKLFLQQ